MAPPAFPTQPTPASQRQRQPAQRLERVHGRPHDEQLVILSIRGCAFSAELRTYQPVTFEKGGVAMKINPSFDNVVRTRARVKSSLSEEAGNLKLVWPRLPCITGRLQTFQGSFLLD